MPALTNNEIATGFNTFFRFTAADVLRAGFLATLGAANQRVIASLPAGGVITRCAVFEAVNATGTSTDLTLDVGITGADPDECIDALDIDGLTKAAFNTGDVLINTAAGYVINNTTGAVPVYMEFNGTLTAAGLTAGEWVIALEILDPGKLAK